MRYDDAYLDFVIQSEHQERMADIGMAAALLAKLNMRELTVLAWRYLKIDARTIRWEGWTKQELIDEMAELYFDDQMA